MGPPARARGRYGRPVRGDTRRPSVRRRSWASRAGPPGGGARAMRRRSAGGSAGLGGRPGRACPRQPRRHPCRGPRSHGAGWPRTSAPRQATPRADEGPGWHAVGSASALETRPPAGEANACLRQEPVATAASAPNTAGPRPAPEAASNRMGRGDASRSSHPSAARLPAQRGGRCALMSAVGRGHVQRDEGSIFAEHSGIASHRRHGNVDEGCSSGSVGILRDIGEAKWYASVLPIIFSRCSAPRGRGSRGWLGALHYPAGEDPA
jgi:hypothetical protein